MQRVLVGGHRRRAWVDDTADGIAGFRVLCVDDFMGQELPAPESKVQRHLWLSDGDLELEAEAIQERHAQALKLNLPGHPVCVGKVEVAVDEVKVRRPVHEPTNGVASPIVLNAERVPAGGDTNALRVAQLVLGKGVQHERLNCARRGVGQLRLHDHFVSKRWNSQE
ncbi:MAG: hypothetical protein ACOVN7_04445 [Rubrivivax sp.]